MKKHSYRNHRPKTLQGSIKVNNSVEGLTLENKIELMMANKEPIQQESPLLYTERKDGVLAQTNIRADRFEIAAEAMDSVTKSALAARENKGKVIPLNDDGKADSTHGETSIN